MLPASTRVSGPYVSNGTQRAYPFYFTVFSGAELSVERLVNGQSSVISPTDYTVTIDGTAGGTVTLTTAPIIGDSITIVGKTIASQSIVLSSGGGFYPKVIEKALDRLTMVLQESQTTIGRALKVPSGSGLDPITVFADLLAWLESAKNLSEDLALPQLVALTENMADVQYDMLVEIANREAAIAELLAYAQNNLEMQADIDAVQNAAIFGATAGAKSYLTLASLTAAPAPTVNTLAYVSNDSTSANNGMYTYSGSAWVKSLYDPLTQALAADAAKADITYVNAIDAAFTSVAGKNKFDPTLALDGYYNPYNNGIDQAFANGITFGRQDVVAGNTYTLWLPTAQLALDPILRCYDSSGVFLGNHIPVSTYPVPAVPPTGVVWSDSNHTVTFTIPVGSSIAKIAANTGFISHTTAQFNDAVNTLQMELGSAKTAYEPYAVGGDRVLKMSRLPAVFALRSELPVVLYQPPALLERASSTMVALDGTYAYIRTRWSVTLDLVQRVQYGSTTTFGNNVVNPYDVKTIPIATAAENTITAYATGALIVSHVDDAAPCQYNFTYIGANHGAAIVHQVTVTGHGKTTVDVGSRWTQAANTFTIMRIVDVNTMWLISQNAGSTYWSFINSSLSGIALTHLAGATNASGFTPSADTVGTQLYPAVRNHAKTVRLDGRTAISASGVYYAEFVDIVDTYDICNPPAVVAYVQSQVGSSIQPAFDHSSIASDMRVALTYRYASNGSLSVTQQYQAKANLRMNYLGGIQALPLSYAGKTLLQYVPKLNPIVGTLKTWNLSAIEDITTQVETLTFTPATWSDANNPPDRMVQIVKTGSTKNHGFVIGYGLQRGHGVPATRKLAAASDCGFLNASTRKMYPKLVTNSGFASNMMNAGQVVSAVAYRSFYNFDAVPNATVCTWYYEGSDIIVVFDIHESVTALQIPLPSWMSGLSATVLDASASFSLLTPIATDDGLLVTVTSGYGQASIKLK